MPFNDNGRDACLSGGLGNAISRLSLHTANPGTTGANEVAGGAPAYARQLVGWAAAASGQRRNAGAVVFDVPDATDVYFVGFWDAGATFYGYAPIGAGLAGFGAVDADGVTGDAVASAAHGLANGEQVIVANVFAESLPGGLAEGTAYFVVGATADTFQLSAASGGAAIDLSSAGELFWQQVVPETFTEQGTLTIADAQLALDLTAI